MNEELFADLVSQIKIGKNLPDAIYLHKDAIDALPKVLLQFVRAVAKAVKLEDENWNLLKLFKKEFRLSLLHYPDFYSESYPALKQSVNIDLTKLSHKVTRYEESDNPPILHRKETMILIESEYYEPFKALTLEGEIAGLYNNSRLIGFKRSWENVITRNGCKLVDGHIVEDSNILRSESLGIDRYKTAIVRNQLSAPMKTLAKHGYLEGSYSIFDYGCGRGDDLRELEAHGLDVLGWDPNFKPDNEKIKSDIINLGFVLNVIEDQDERLEALLLAWELAEKFLVVSVMLANENYISQFKPYKDGVITSRNTFQKYYLQSEIKSYIERHLQEDVLAVAPGIFYIFKNKLEEQIYLQRKYTRHYKWNQLTSGTPIESKDKYKIIILQNQNLFNLFWSKCLDLGRIPSNDEFDKSDEIRSCIGSHKKAFNLLQEMYDVKEYETAQQSRKEDLLLYFTLELFGKRKAYTQQTESLKKDIKVLFGDYKNAFNLAKELLYSIANTELINEECNSAHLILPASVLNKGHSLVLHRRYIDELPLLLRVYIAAGLHMYGEIDESIDLIKIHITSGKLTLTTFDDFNNSIPFLVERIKIKMAEQDIDFFDYVDDSRRPPLLNKHLLIDNNHQDYEKQKSFDKRLAKLLNIDSKCEVILHRKQYEDLLNISGKRVKGFILSGH
jgi:DNA phosphorothioation-associated putative methyltransferase